jgi:hypothetical protein
MPHVLTLDLKTYLPNGYCVSTVDPLDAIYHDWNFETMVFSSEGEKIINFAEFMSRHYDTREEAEAGHADVVAEYQGKPQRTHTGYEEEEGE